MKQPRKITVDNLADASQEEVFEHIVWHMLKQGDMSEAGDGTCVYRAADGKRCAAGSLFTAKQYHDLKIEQYEGRTWRNLVNDRLAPNDHVNLIKELQSVHDNGGPDKWSAIFREIAEREGFSVRVMDHFEKEKAQ